MKSMNSATKKKQRVTRNLPFYRVYLFSSPVLFYTQTFDEKQPVIISRFSVLLRMQFRLNQNRRPLSVLIEKQEQHVTQQG